MHIAVMVATIFAAWRWADWRNWEKYHATMLYVVLGNFIYHLFYHDHLLWQLKPDYLVISYTLVEILYTVTVMPLAVMLLLSNYPKELGRRLYRLSKFIAVFIILEFVFLYFNRIVYKFGWNIWWSLAWDLMMFPMIVLHYRKPLLAYLLSIFAVMAVLGLFPVPIE